MTTQTTAKLTGPTPAMRRAEIAGGAIANIETLYMDAIKSKSSEDIRAAKKAMDGIAIAATDRARDLTRRL